MTESRIFEILLKNNKNENYTYDYPKLQKEAVEFAAEKFTEVIYETLKQKSTASHLKRGNILKYIHTSCRVKECHLEEESYECFFNILRKSFESNETTEVSQLLEQIHFELETEVPTSLVDKVVDFYKTKSLKQRERNKKLEFISKKRQEKLDMKFGMEVKKKFSYYEPSENMIRDLIGHTSTESENKPSLCQTYTKEYREKQIKFCYAILNLKHNICYIETILQRLSFYKKLEPFEINFLMYLWLFEDKSLDFALILSEKFPFIIERLILKYATEILNFTEDTDVHRYFINLENEKKLVKVRKICSENTLLSKTVKSLIYQLYYYSSCNENVLKLIDFIQ